MAEHPARTAHGRLRRILCLDDFEGAARRHLPKPVFEYVAGGVEDNLTRDHNRASFREQRLVPRVLVGVTERRMSVALFGKDYAAPFGIAPIGIAALYAYRGDLALAEAASDSNVPMVMSGSSLIRMEDVIERCPDTWFQAYLPGDRGEMTALADLGSKVDRHLTAHCRRSRNA